jgi:hypothetical protein
VVLGEPRFVLGERGRRDPLGSTGRKTFSSEVARVLAWVKIDTDQSMESIRLENCHKVGHSVYLNIVV